MIFVEYSNMIISFLTKAHNEELFSKKKKMATMMITNKMTANVMMTLATENIEIKSCI